MKALEENSPSKDMFLAITSSWAGKLGLLIIAIFLFTGLNAWWLAPYNPTEVFPGAHNIPPFFLSGSNPKFILGTDDLGRDLLSRLIYGGQISMLIGFLVVVVSTSSGTILGLMSGYFGGWIDQLIMRIVDTMMALPSILLAIVIAAILGPGLTNTILAVSFVSVPHVIRLVRACTLAEIKKPYVTASRTFGAGPWRQMFINILPNCVAPLTVQATLGFSNGILDAAALGFLGLGARPPMPEWGTMLSDARAYIESAPYLVTMPGICILLVVLGLNMLGDGLRDALDPRLKKS